MPVPCISCEKLQTSVHRKISVNILDINNINVCFEKIARECY